MDEQSISCGTTRTAVLTAVLFFFTAACNPAPEARFEAAAKKQDKNDGTPAPEEK